MWRGSRLLKGARATARHCWDFSAWPRYLALFHLFLASAWLWSSVDQGTEKLGSIPRLSSITEIDSLICDCNTVIYTYNRCYRLLTFISTRLPDLMSLLLLLYLVCMYLQYGKRNRHLYICNITLRFDHAGVRCVVYRFTCCLDHFCYI